MEVVDKNGKPIPFKNQESKRVFTGLVAVFLGAFGAHKFVLGYMKEGAILLIATIALVIFTCGSLTWITVIIGVVEGVVYLSKTDEEFINTYQINKKEWF